MSDIEKYFGKDALQQICAGVGDVDEQEVERVLESVLPQLQAECDSDEFAQRAAAFQQEPERGLGAANLLPLLLGNNLGGVTSQVSQSSGVNQNKTGSILKIAAPLLLIYILKKKMSQAQQQQQAQFQQLQQAQEQSQNPLGGGLFSMLFGGQQQQPQPQSSGLLGGLLSLLK